MFGIENSTFTAGKNVAVNERIGSLMFNGKFDDKALNMLLTNIDITQYKVISVDNNSGVVIFKYTFEFKSQQVIEEDVNTIWYDQIDGQRVSIFNSLV